MKITVGSTSNLVFQPATDRGKSAKITISSGGGGDAGSAYGQANAARGQANSAYSQANGAYNVANAAYNAANNAQVTVYANSASGVTTQNINFVNTSTITVEVSSSGSNANVAFTAVSGAAYDQANAARGQANSARTTANGAYNQANGAYAQANDAYAQANNAYDAANNRVLRAGDTMTGNLTMSGATINAATANISTIVTGNTLLLSTGIGSNSDVTINANGNYTWTFRANGLLDLPGNITNFTACSAINFVADSSGDGYEYSTIEIRPDSGATLDQYLIIDPTAPNHIHIRAGGQQDNSNAELYIGGENSYFKVDDGENPSISIASNNYFWTFDTDGKLTIPGDIIPSQNLTWNLGSPTNKFNDLYIGGNTVYIGEAILSTNGDTVTTNTFIAELAFESGGLNVLTQANTARDQANNAYGVSNAAYGQANAAYAEANTKLPLVGGTISGDLIVSGNLVVSGNSTTLNTEILIVEDADIVLLSNVTSTPALNAGLIINRGTSPNTFLRWAEDVDKWGWSDDGSTFYSFDTSLNAYAQANNARDQANTARTQANTAYGQANDAYGQANTARNQANTAYGQANAAYGQANAAYGQANAAYGQANSARDQANTARTTANDAYNTANTKVSKSGDTMTGDLTINTVLYANQANITTTLNVGTSIVIGTGGAAGDITGANAIFAESFFTNDGINLATSAATSTAAYVQANNARDQANTARGTANDAYGQANTARDQANTARTTANDSYAQANTARDQANTSRDQANTARDQANTARDQANTARDQANTARTQANTARNQANTAYESANTKSESPAVTYYVQAYAPNPGGSSTYYFRFRYPNGTGDNTISGDLLYGYNDETGVGEDEDSPTIVLHPGTTVKFVLSDLNPDTGAGLQVFAVQTFIAGVYSHVTSGIYHIATNGNITTGKGFADSGTIVWTIPQNVPGTTKYIYRSPSNNDGVQGQFRIATYAAPASLQANTARDQANTARTQANTARDTSNNSYVQANSAYDQANTARNTANNAYVQANGAYAQANNAANTARVSANSGSTLDAKHLNFINSASVFVSVTPSGDGTNANISFITSGASIGDAYVQANAARDQANTAREQANTARTQANTARDTGNNAYAQANSDYMSAEAYSITVTEPNPVGFVFRTFEDGGSSGAVYTAWDSPATQANPSLWLRPGSTIAFRLVDLVSPLNGPQGFALYSDSYTSLVSSGLTHVALDGTLSVGTSAQNKQTGTLYWTIPSSAAGSTYYYGSNQGNGNLYRGQFYVDYYAASVRNLAMDAFNQANTARDQANTARTQANNSYLQANTARDQANTARDQANTARGQANNAYAEANLKLNLTGGTINGSLNISGNLFVTGNTTFINTSTYTVDDPLIYLAANNILTDIVDIGFVGAKNSGSSVTHTGFARDAGDGIWYLFDNLANSGHENNVIDFANTSLATLRANIDANSITLVSNTVATHANLIFAFNQANTARDTANNSYAQANVARDTANGAYVQANGAYAQANGAYNQANGAYAQANGAYAQANGAYNQANGAYAQANGAYNQANNSANTVRVYANSAGELSNKFLNFINTASIQVDVSSVDGNANIAFNTTGAAVADAYAQANIARNTSNSAYAQANNAYNAANNATVRVSANSGSITVTPNINFINTSTVSVSVVSGDNGNANVSLISSGSQQFTYDTTTTSAETVDSWSASTYRSGRYQMQVENLFGFLALEIMLLHDGATTNLVKYAETTIGSGVGTFSSDISSGLVRLRFTPNDPTSQLTYYKSLLTSRISSDALPIDLMTGSIVFDLMNSFSLSPSDLNA